MSWVLFIRVQFWEGQRYLQQPVKRGATLFLRRYRVNFRPRYVTKYKMVTQLEWKCCPGFRGADCQEGPRDPTKTPRPTPARPRNSLKRPTGNFLPVLGCAWAPLSFPISSHLIPSFLVHYNPAIPFGSLTQPDYLTLGQFPLNRRNVTHLFT